MAKWTINEYGPEGLKQIEPLWNALNQVHFGNSKYFQDHYRHFTFEQRKSGLLNKSMLRIFLAVSDDSNIAYCICSIDNRIGEVDSIYVAPEFQRQCIGTLLMDAAMQWLANRCERIQVSVAEGNESVFPFYEKYGFRKRKTILEQN